MSLCTKSLQVSQYVKKAQQLYIGDIINIKQGIKHCHIATKDSWFSNLTIEVLKENTSTEWLQIVSDEEYNKL